MSSSNVFPCGWRKCCHISTICTANRVQAESCKYDIFGTLIRSTSSQLNPTLTANIWMSTNTAAQITLTGFSFVVINFLTMLWYTPTLDQDCPPWVYLSWAIGLFLYQTFDAVDGSQARRTRQSGPLGELFDHGVDAINTTLEVLLFSAVMNLGQGWKTVLTLFACQ